MSSDRAPHRIRLTNRDSGLVMELSDGDQINLGGGRYEVSLIGPPFEHDWHDYLNGTFCRTCGAQRGVSHPCYP